MSTTKQKPAKKTGKKPEEKKEKTSTISQPKTPSQGDTVNYVLPEKDRQIRQLSPKDPGIIPCEVLRVKNNEVVIKFMVRPGESVERGCFYHSGKNAGTWHWPE